MPYAIIAATVIAIFAARVSPTLDLVLGGAVLGGIVMFAVQELQ